VQRIGLREGLKLSAPLNKPFAREAVVQLVGELRSAAVAGR